MRNTGRTIQSVKEAGFSLIELMLVLLIVAVVSSAVSLSVWSASSEQKRLEKTGRKLYAQMRFAADESLIKYQIIGLRIDQNDDESFAYSWHRYRSAGWEKIDGVLSPVSLPQGLLLEATIDDELFEALQEESLNDLGEEEVIPPGIIFYPNSDVSEFELVLAFEGFEQEAFKIYLDERGNLNNSTIDASVDRDEG